jgi:AraC family transcriptional regulator
MPGAIQKVWERIFQEWFPATGYEHAEAPELEVYPDGNTAAEDYRCEVWIPVVKK